MSDCIFCKIAKGELPCYKVCEDSNFIGFLDSKPLNPGHVLLAPKTHYRWIYEYPNPAEAWGVANRIAIAAKEAVKSDSISFLTMGFDVEHGHIHIIPRWIDDSHRHKGIDAAATIVIAKEKMQEIADSIFQKTK